MGWLTKFVDTVKGSKPEDWTFVTGVSVPGSTIADFPIEPDECYIELYVDSLKLGKTRKFATTFDGIVYAFAETARDGDIPTKFAAVTKPQEITNIGQTSLNDVITFEKRLFKVIPWRGNPLDIELGLFSIKTGNIASKIADYVVRLSNTVSPGITAAVNPMLPLVTEGLDLLAGQTNEVELELAVDTSLTPDFGKHYALIRRPAQEIDATELSVAPGGRLRYRNADLDVSYCLFSVRPRRDNPSWGEIEALRVGFDDLKKAILAGQIKLAEEALSGFRRMVVVCPDLITSDKMRLQKKAKELVETAFAGGMVSADREKKQSLERMSVTDLDLYQ